MTLTHDQVLEHLKHEFRGLGYVGGLLQEDYAFADVLASHYAVKRIPLAAFVQEPPSYRTASFGVAVANGRSGIDSILDHRSLGAPQILEINDDRVLRWKVTGKGIPVLLDEVGVDRLHGFFTQHRDDWAPQQVLRAKSAGPVATQLDFLDLDLMPLLDYEVRTKLDALLRDTVALARRTFQRNLPFTEKHYPPLFRLIFRLIASKVLTDRRYQGDWDLADPTSAIEAVENLYFRDAALEPVLQDYDTQLAVWQRIKETFHFQNLSVDSLAYVYENTLVTQETRRLFGIHSTPPEIAEYIVRRLPFDSLKTHERRVFEPFSGHSVFLVAAMQRMRELLPAEMNSRQRHDYFVEMLSGIEIDDFAREVAKLSLMLADYPNPDGWRLYGGDALKSSLFEQELAKANIVLCNPPFETFSEDERSRYDNLFSVRKPAEILGRVLQNPPELLGFVLPRVFLKGQGYRKLRSQLGNTYASVELLALPERVFQYSRAETVLLLAYGHGQGTVRLRAGEVYEGDHKGFYTIQPSYEFDETVEDAGGVFEHGMWRPPLPEVWQATANLKRLSDISSVHRGIEYNLPFNVNESQLVSNKDMPGFVPGVHKVRGNVEPFAVLNTVFLNVSVDFMRTSAYTLPWDKPKLIVNASRQSVGHWKITASLDNGGLVCYQNFHGVWPNDGISLEVLAAVLNGPVANAFVSTHGTGRHVTVQSLKGIPVPEFGHTQQQHISSLVKQYLDARSLWLTEGVGADEARQLCTWLLKSIDAEVLRAYDLSPRIERTLLDYFSGYSRLGPVEFTEYYPPGFSPYIPWHIYISEEFKEAQAKDTLDRLPVIPASTLINEALSYVE